MVNRRWVKVDGEAPHVFPMSSDQPPSRLPNELLPVADAMLRRPKGWIAGSYEGPRGSDWVEATFLHDGDRRWRIESARDLVLHDGVSAFTVKAAHVHATHSDSLAAHSFLKAMLQPSRFADLDRQLPMLTDAELQGVVDYEGRSCWKLGVQRPSEEQHWLVERDSGRVMSIASAEHTARIFDLSNGAHPSDAFAWDGPIDEDDRV